MEFSLVLSDELELEGVLKRKKKVRLKSGTFLTKAVCAGVEMSTCLCI